MGMQNRGAMVSRIRITRLICLLCSAILVAIVYCEFVRPATSIHHLWPSLNANLDANGSKMRRFAVFSCATPGPNSHRGYDYAFYLPLTVVAWHRIGFESLVLIVGEKSEWKTHPILSHVLATLERLSDDATVMFLSAEVENRMMLSQVVRICAANMKDFPGRPSDFLMTTDADLWPLRRKHYYQPQGMNRSLMLLHNECCGSFSLAGRSYTMLPMQVGASAATWKEIINGDSSAPIELTDSASILNYFQQMFGQRVRQSVAFASDDWYMDQKMLSIRVDQWLSRRHGNQSKNQASVYKASDSGLLRIDRSYWSAEDIRPNSFVNYYDAHLIYDGFTPENWKTIQPLLRLMYGKNSTRYEFCNRYATEFYEQFTQFGAN